MAFRGGHRVRHRTLKSCVVTVTVTTAPVHEDVDVCLVCGVPHPQKTLHLSLDSDGACLVSPGVLNTLRKAGGIDVPNAPFIYESHVPDPPTINLSVSRGGVKELKSRPVIHVDYNPDGR